MRFKPQLVHISRTGSILTAAHFEVIKCIIDIIRDVQNSRKQTFKITFLRSENNFLNKFNVTKFTKATSLIRVSPNPN